MSYFSSNINVENKNKLTLRIVILICVTTIFYKKKILQNTINENDLSVKTTELSNELLETLKILKNWTSCKDKKIDGNLAELEKEEQGKKKEYIIKELNNELFKINIRLNKEIL